MSEALFIAAASLYAQDQNLQTIANNISNANTPGFKKSRIGFSDLMAREAATPSSSATEGVFGPAQMRLGAGVSVASISKVFDMGELKKTDSPFDIAIQGEGFLEVTLEDGSSAFTRGGTLKVNKDGLLATASGFVLKPSIAIPDKAESMTIARDGRVTVRVAGETNAVEVGQLDLMRFAVMDQLEALGDNLYRSTSASGDASSVKPGDEGAATIVQGVLEASNVKMVDEMVNLMLAQRTYEASAKVAQAADEMHGLVNNLRK